jgi:fermentation-respiration switch protein FrsA (DUF1100 family)
MKSWLRSGAYFAVGYVGFVLMLLGLENTLLYHPVSAARDWMPSPVLETEDVELTCADGTRIHAWWCPAKNSDLALLYCHGNAGNLSHRGTSVVQLRDHLNTSVLIIDYPGYGKSEGSPSEQGCYHAADSAYQWLAETKQYSPKKIILYGGSLGGGVATDLASRQDHRALVLVKTYTSVPDAACDIYWWLPVPIRPLMTNRFESLTKIASCQRPVFIAHGTADEMIPFDHGKKLFEAANEPKRFLAMEGNRHNDSLPEMFFTSLNEFLKSNAPD